MRVLDGQFLTTALENALVSAENLRDRAFTQALCYGICRHFHQIEFVLNHLVEKPIKDDEIKALALVGLYQLAFMRVKPHAAVSETVQSVPRKKVWAKNLLNGIFRRFLREREQLDNLIQQHKVAKLSHPTWLIDLIQHDWGDEKTQAILKTNNELPPMILRVNLSKASRETYLSLLKNESIEAEYVEECQTAIRLIKPVPVEVLPYFFEGWVSVQDTAAQLAAELLNTQAGQRVLDLCAAPAGKMAHILELQPQIDLTAVDIDAQRMERVKATCHRLDLKATLIVGDATKPKMWWGGELFDRILLDAPCSALGVIRRHPDIKLLRRASDIKELQTLQQQILVSAWQMLKPNGILLYATCSILKQENEQQIALFLENHADAQEIPLSDGFHGRQILTGESGMDGFFYAKLIKSV